ncbi:MAG TPA: VWA domain-containing protein [Aestuariivirga sp.]|nr:VWA domain-containing protein [Aestuariivirga sp.]
MQIRSKLEGLVKRFGTCQKGGVAIFYALSAIPLCIAAGSAVDTIRYVANATELQAALDSAALAAAATPELTDEERLAMAEATFVANLENGGLSDAAITRSFAIEDEIVVAAAEMDMATSLMSLTSIDSMTLKIGTEVAVPGDKKAEIALVLDYSGSMNETIAGGVKYVAMKNAAKDLISDLEAANPEKVKFALVPFSHHVYGTLPKSYVLGTSGSGDWTGCTQDRKYPYNLTDDTPTSANDSKWGQAQAPVHAAWGCSGYTSNNLVMEPLSDNFTYLKSRLDMMTPYAWTHIALGVEFGFHMLSDNAPFEEGASYDDDETKKFMVVLTDGAQTEPAFGSGSTRTVAQGEANLEALCANAKAKDITVITIAYDLDDNATTQRLKNCATDPDSNFFVATDTAAVASAFNNIKTIITAEVFISK